MNQPGGSSSSNGKSNRDKKKKKEKKKRMNFVRPTNSMSLERLDEHVFPNSEFSSAPTQFANSSYISFDEPVFTTNVVIDQPSHFNPEVMMASQNFNTINYPVFSKFGYLYDGSYCRMAKKGATRQRNKSLWRRGTPRLETIWEEPEPEDEQEAPKKDKSDRI